MAIDIDELRVGDSSWYEFPDGTKLQGKKAAKQYAEELAELDGIAEEEAALDAEEEAAEEEVADEPLVAGKVDATPREVVDAAEGDEGAPTDNKNTPYERESYLVEMTRQNRMFEYAGKSKNYLFRHDAKILVVEGEDVQGLISEGGFRIVTPEQAKAYYS